MAGRLPETVRTRAKTPLQSDPIAAQVRRGGTEKLETIPLSPELGRFIKSGSVAQPHGKMNSEQLTLSLRPRSFNIWLQLARRIRYNIRPEAMNG